MAPKNPNRTTLRDGRWYSIIVKYPRQHQDAKWVADQQEFVWGGTSETKSVPYDEVDEILHEVDPEALNPGVTYLGR
ncbi:MULTISPECIES: hypothetical protein [Mycobacterium avium complex (MAC)]|uniref:hypothetical protein n=1 Tax=Mycobacterium avium complex (MAC) TaxID=120793 RepID=UPI000A00E315|nr:MULTISPECIES: hypothetical protein [Mycobacterium avium complex (MAC)]UCN12546.1 hypothetical protein LFT50_29045 [Mycobacterium intracellulare subsp. chimaera]